MSILKSNNADFKITVDWLKNRGYESIFNVNSYSRKCGYDTDHPSYLYYFGRTSCALHLKYRLNIERRDIESWKEELIFIGAYINDALCEIKNVNDLIKVENYWMKDTIFKNRDMFDKI